MKNKILASMWEEASEFMKDPKKKIRNLWENFKSRHQLFIEHLVVYLKYFVKFRFIPVYIFLFLLTIFFPTDANSARYMLSALVQSQAAIIAIIITLTLIAVQLTASAYSPRVINIFRKNPDMWILLGLYGTSIFYGLIVLRLVKETEGGFVIQDVIGLFDHILLFIWPYQNFSDHISFLFECLFSIALLLGIITFVALAPYIKNITDLLKPEKIIEQLATDITTECKEYNSKEDPIQPIMDIIRGSIRKYDFETTKEGLEEVTNQVIKVVDSDCKEEISNSFCTRLQGVGKLAASVTDEESTEEVIENLERFGKDTAGKGFGDAAQEVVKSLEAVGIAAARKGTELEDAVKDAALSLGGVGKAAAGNKLDDAVVQTALSLEGVGKAAAGNKLDDAVVQTALSLWGVEDKTVKEVDKKNILKNVSEQVASSLGAVGKAAAEKGKDLEKAIIKVIENLENVGKAAAANKLYVALERTVLSLEGVGKAAAGNKLDGAVERTVLSLDAVEDKTVKEVDKKNILENLSELVASSLVAVGEVAAENELKGAIGRIATSLCAVGKIAVKNKLEGAIKEVASSLVAVGTSAVKKRGLDDATRQVALFLAELSTLNEKIVRNRIQDHERDLDGPDLDYFKQFIKIYEDVSQK